MSDRLFHQVDDVQVILYRKGVYTQAKVYSRLIEGRRYLYAAIGNGFVRLLGATGTSSPYVSWTDLHAPQDCKIEYNNLGRPFLA